MINGNYHGLVTFSRWCNFLTAASDVLCPWKVWSHPLLLCDNLIAYLPDLTAVGTPNPSCSVKPQSTCVRIKQKKIASSKFVEKSKSRTREVFLKLRSCLCFEVKPFKFNADSKSVESNRKEKFISVSTRRPICILTAELPLFSSWDGSRLRILNSIYD